MGILAMIVIVLFLMLFLLLSLKLRLQITSRGQRIEIVMKLWKVPVFHIHLILVFRQGVIPYVYRERKKLCVRMFPKLKKPKEKAAEWIKYVLRKSYQAEKMHIDAVIGTGDAAETAYAVGLGSVLLENVLAAKRLCCEDQIIRVTPDFSRETLAVKLNCIITVRVADIIRKGIFSERRKKHEFNRKHTEKHNV